MPGGTYTFLFTDLVRSTEILDELGDAANEPLRRAHARLLRSQIEEHGGRQVKSTGDGVMAAFGAASDAVSCAVAVQQAIDLHNRTSGLPALGVRIGVHLGEVEEEDGDYFGTTVVVASRLCALAEGGEIMVSDVVRAVVAGRGVFEFEPLGPLALKGFTEPVPASRVQWASLQAADAVSESAGADPFVGRTTELAELTRGWESACGGTQRLVLVSGEPGIGKTRLALRLAETASAAGALTLIGRCDEQAPVPYLPFTEALSPYRTLDLAAVATSGAAAIPAGEDTERYRFYAAVTTAFEELAAETPVLLILDDLHWADEGTLLLLRHLLRRTVTARLMVVATYRDTDLSRTHPLSAALGELARLGASRVDLRGLGLHDVAALLGEEVAPGAVEQVHAETEGNPFFVHEVARHLAEGGHAATVPQGVRDVIGRRLTRLREETVSLLQVAAVIGRDFDLALLSGVAGVSEDHAIGSLEEAQEARLVDEVAGVLDRYRFSHALVRDALRHEVGTSRRVRLHDRVVVEMERLFADLTPHALAIAHHANEAAAAGGTERAARYALLAAREAERRFGGEEAARLCAMGLQTLDLGDDNPRLRCELLLVSSSAIGWANMSVSQRDASAALAIARELKDPLLFADASIKQCLIEPGVYREDYVDSLEEALRMLPAEETAYRACVLAVLSAIGVFGPDPALARTRREEAVELARLARNAPLAVQALYFATFPVAASGDVTVADEVLDRAREAGMRQLEIAGRSVRVTALLHGCDIEAVRGELVELEALEQEVPAPLLRYQRTAVAATLASIEGRYDDARRLGREAGELALVAVALGQYGPVSGAILAFPRLREQGRSAQMVETTRAAAELYPGAGGWRGALAALLIDTGDLDAARRELQTIARDDFRMLRDEYAGTDRYGIAMTIDAAAAAGDLDALTALEPLLRADAHLGVSLAFGPVPLQWLGSARLYLGIANAALGRADAAEDDLRVALEVHDRGGARVASAWTRHHLAAVLASRNESSEEATALRREAADTAAELGLVRLQRAAAA